MRVMGDNGLNIICDCVRLCLVIFLSIPLALIAFTFFSWLMLSGHLKKELRWADK